MPVGVLSSVSHNEGQSCSCLDRRILAPHHDRSMSIIYQAFAGSLGLPSLKYVAKRLMTFCSAGNVARKLGRNFREESGSKWELSSFVWISPPIPWILLVAIGFSQRCLCGQSVTSRVFLKSDNNSGFEARHICTPPQ